MEFAYEAEVKDGVFMAVSEKKIKAEDADRNRLYVCPKCKNRVFLRGGFGTMRRIHFGGYHVKGCEFASKKKVTVINSSTDKTNVEKIVNRISRKSISNIKVPVTGTGLDEDHPFSPGKDEEIGLVKTKKTEQTAAGISRVLDKKPLDFVIGVMLEEDAQYVNGKFYAKKDTIEYFRASGFTGYNLILVRPCEKVPEDIVVKPGYYCFRDVFTDRNHDESAIYLLIKYMNDEVEKRSNRKIRRLKPRDVVVIMGCFDDVGQLFHRNTYETIVTNAACVGKRKDYLPASKAEI